MMSISVGKMLEVKRAGYTVFEVLRCFCKLLITITKLLGNSLDAPLSSPGFLDLRNSEALFELV